MFDFNRTNIFCGESDRDILNFNWIRILKFPVRITQDVCFNFSLLVFIRSEKRNPHMLSFIYLSPNILVKLHR